MTIEELAQNGVRRTLCARNTRRSWLAGAAGALSLSPLARAARKHTFHSPLGVQLYTLRDVIGKAPAETLRRIAAIGYKEVETAGQNLDQYAPLFRDAGLNAVSCHADPTAVYGEHPSKTPFADFAASAKKHGFEYVVFPYLFPAERGNAEMYRAFADKLNRAGEQANAAGLRFCYHNHAFEFQGAEGQRPIDILADRLDPKLVGFEVDVFWVSSAGVDPVAHLKRFSGRVPLVHLKDKLAGSPVIYDEAHAKPDSFREVGSGSLDFAAIIDAARAAGAKHFFVEQDHTPGDPLASLAKSFAYLSKLKVSAA